MASKKRQASWTQWVAPCNCAQTRDACLFFFVRMNPGVANTNTEVDGRAMGTCGLAQPSVDFAWISQRRKVKRCSTWLDIIDPFFVQFFDPKPCFGYKGNEIRMRMRLNELCTNGEYSPSKTLRLPRNDRWSMDPRLTPKPDKRGQKPHLPSEWWLSWYSMFVDIFSFACATFSFFFFLCHLIQSMWTSLPTCGHTRQELPILKSQKRYSRHK